MGFAALMALGCGVSQSDSVGSEPEATDSADSDETHDTAPEPEGVLALTNRSGGTVTDFLWWREDGEVSATAGAKYQDGQSWDFRVPAGTGTFEAWNADDDCWAHEYSVADGETVSVEIGVLTGVLDGSWCVM